MKWYLMKTHQMNRWNFPSLCAVNVSTRITFIEELQHQTGTAAKRRLQESKRAKPKLRIYIYIHSCLIIFAGYAHIQCSYFPSYPQRQKKKKKCKKRIKYRTITLSAKPSNKRGLLLDRFLFISTLVCCCCFWGWGEFSTARKTNCEMTRSRGSQDTHTKRNTKRT